MEAYLLRCTFLKAEQSMAMRLLVPSLTINTTASNNSGGNAAGAIDTVSFLLTKLVLLA